MDVEAVSGLCMTRMGIGSRRYWSSVLLEDEYCDHYGTRQLEDFVYGRVSVNGGPE